MTVWTVVGISITGTPTLEGHGPPSHLKYDQVPQNYTQCGNVSVIKAASKLSVLFMPFLKSRVSVFPSLLSKHSSLEIYRNALEHFLTQIRILYWRREDKKYFRAPAPRKLAPHHPTPPRPRVVSE